MARPATPSDLKINGIPESDGLLTKAVGSVTANAFITDANNKQKVKLVVRYSTVPNFATYYQVASEWIVEGHRATVTLDRLNTNTQYWVRAYSRDKDGHWSNSYNATSFFTALPPNAPVPVSPADNLTFDPTQPIPFDWHPTDPDEGGDPSPVSAFTLLYRTAGTAYVATGPWVQAASIATSATNWTAPGNFFKPSTTYEWTVAVRDPQGLWSPWSQARRFITEGVTTPPLLVGPTGDTTVAVDEKVTFKWLFRDPYPGSQQGNADIQYRAVGASSWVLIAGSALTGNSWTFDENTFQPGLRYEWQVRTYRSTGSNNLSEWSNSAYFWGVLTPGSKALEPLPVGEGIQGALGCGKYKAYIFERGGVNHRGEIGPLIAVNWARLRDDISHASVVVEGFDQDCGQLLGDLHTWAYEMVLFRDGQRVWEGPITRITYQPGHVEIEAQDVMAYLYRRILRQGYNDSYHLVNGVQQGLKTVVDRAGLITVNCLGYDDPNVLPYLTLLRSGTDARQSRIVPDYTKTAWEEVDDLASSAGLDYTTVGRRIIYWDTHNYVGVLPEMRDGDFSEPLTVTEYGMNAANYFAVTDGQGAWGAAIPPGRTQDNWSEFYGPLEQLASGYGDVAAGDPTTMTPDQLAAVEQVLASQAQRNVNGRWPAPLVARVPDNATISPDVNVGINQLIPGTWIPLRVEQTVRKFAQMQKLDSINVSFTPEAGEKVGVVMSPAPQGFLDPDASADPEDAP